MQKPQVCIVNCLLTVCCLWIGNSKSAHLMWHPYTRNCYDASCLYYSQLTCIAALEMGCPATGVPRWNFEGLWFCDLWSDFQKRCWNSNWDHSASVLIFQVDHACLHRGEVRCKFWCNERKRRKNE